MFLLVSGGYLKAVVSVRPQWVANCIRVCLEVSAHFFALSLLCVRGTLLLTVSGMDRLAHFSTLFMLLNLGTLRSDAVISLFGSLHGNVSAFMIWLILLGCVCLQLLIRYHSCYCLL